MHKTWKNAGRLMGVFLLGSLSLACAKAEYVGNGSKGFWSDTPSKVAPNEAFRVAQPYLDVTWEKRCEEVRMQDEYCDAPAVDHMVRKGSFYYITRTSFPYEDVEEYTHYAVRVNANTGEIIPYE